LNLSVLLTFLKVLSLNSETLLKRTKYSAQNDHFPTQNNPVIMTKFVSPELFVKTGFDCTYQLHCTKVQHQIRTSARGWGRQSDLWRVTNCFSKNRIWILWVEPFWTKKEITITQIVFTLTNWMLCVTKKNFCWIKVRLN